MVEKECIPVLILAAGRGERAGHSADGPKQYRRIGGRSILSRTIEAFRQHPLVGQIVLVVHPDDEEFLYSGVVPRDDGILVVHGGSSRQESTRIGLDALVTQKPAFVLIHDGVRPFVDTALIDRVIDGVDRQNGAIPALPVSDTLKQCQDNGIIDRTVSRSCLQAAQTPQAFDFQNIHKAHKEAARHKGMEFTDDASIAEWAGIAVRVVMGSPDNIKITLARDVDLADQRLTGDQPGLPDVRTGNGYDVHAFSNGNGVILCGENIPHDRKLSGHSDADVALHAITDALLATCGAGDIGAHFPPSEERWKDAPSRIFVEYACSLVRQAGGRIANVDVTLICESPKIGPHRERMTASLAAMIGIDAQRISVKATTNEKLGFIGRGEGIAAIATASVVFPGEL